MQQQVPITLTPYPVKVQIKMRKHSGHFVVGQQAVYYISSGSASALWGAIGKQFGLVGAAVTAVGEKGMHGGAQPGSGPVTEEQLRIVVQESPGSMILVAGETEWIKYTLWMRGIRWRGQMIGFGQGLPKPLRAELRAWAERVGVPIKGKL